MVSREQKFERRGGAPEPDATGSKDASAELEALVRELRSDLRGIYGSLKRIVFVEWQRLRLRAVDTFFRVAFLLCLLGFAAMTGITAAIFLMLGIRAALVEWSESYWIGNLVSGGVVLTVALSALFAVRALARRGIVNETRTKLGAGARSAGRLEGASG